MIDLYGFFIIAVIRLNTTQWHTSSSCSVSPLDSTAFHRRSSSSRRILVFSIAVDRVVRKNLSRDANYKLNIIASVNLKKNS